MKALLFIPQIYSLSDMLQDGFKANSWESKIVDYQELIKPTYNWFYNKTVGLPKKTTKYWKPRYYKLINEKYIAYCEQEKPNIILIYNNQFFFPKTIKKLKENSKIIFILEDNPLWSKTFDYNLAILKYTDIVISPDSHWQYELSSIGIPNTIKQKYKCDILFIGRNYNDSPGYKLT